MSSDNSRDDEHQSVQWVFRKNCSLTPKQLMAWYASICAVTLVIASGFSLAGYWIVLPFAGLELGLLALAFLVYARHAADFEMVELNSVELKLVVAHGAHRTEKAVPPQWVRLEYNGKYKAPLVLCHQGQQIKFGRFIADKDKPALLREIRAALAKAAHGTPRGVQAEPV